MRKDLKGKRERERRWALVGEAPSSMLAVFYYAFSCRDVEVFVSLSLTSDCPFVAPTRVPLLLSRIITAPPPPPSHSIFVYFTPFNSFMFLDSLRSLPFILL